MHDALSPIGLRVIALRDQQKRDQQRVRCDPQVLPVLTYGPAPCIKTSMQRKWVTRLAIFILAAHFGNVASVLSAEPGTRPASDDPVSWPADYQPSGDYYDWRKTRSEERRVGKECRSRWSP